MAIAGVTAAFTEDIPLTVLSSKSTGAFAGAAGPGAVQVK